MIQVWSNWFQILSRFFAILGFYGILSHRYETSWIVFLSFLYHSLWDFFYFKNLKGFIEFFLDSCWDLTVGLEISFYLTTFTLSKYFQNQYFHESRFELFDESRFFYVNPLEFMNFIEICYTKVCLTISYIYISFSYPFERKT